MNGYATPTERYRAQPVRHGLLCALLAVCLVGLAKPTIAATSTSAPANEQPASAPSASSQPATGPTSTPADRSLADILSDSKKIPTQGASPTTGLVYQMLASILVIVVLGGIAIFVIKRIVPKVKRPAHGRVHIEETIYFGPRKSLHVVRVGTRKLLLAGTRESVTMLADVTDALSEAQRDEQDGDE